MDTNMNESKYQEECKICGSKKVSKMKILNVGKPCEVILFCDSCKKSSQSNGVFFYP